MITGASSYIVSAFVFAYAVLAGYGLVLRARARRERALAGTGQYTTSAPEDAR